MKTEDSIESLEAQPMDETKPGLGQHYCIPCAKYFETSSAKSHHQKGKVHKRRVKLLKEGPYTHEEANAAAGHDVQKFMTMKAEREKISSGEPVKKVLAKPPKEEVEETAPAVETMQTEEN